MKIQCWTGKRTGKVVVAVPNLFGPKDRYHGRQFFLVGRETGGRDTHSCCEAQFLIGHGLVPGPVPGLGDQWHIVLYIP